MRKLSVNIGIIVINILLLSGIGGDAIGNASSPLTTRFFTGVFLMEIRGHSLFAIELITSLTVVRASFVNWTKY